MDAGLRSFGKTSQSRTECWIMLTELHEMASSLRRFHIPVERRHPWVRRLEKGDYLVLELY